MFLHLGADTVIQTDHILGIFDLDTTTVQKSSREYLNLAEKAGRVVNALGAPLRGAKRLGEGLRSRSSGGYVPGRR